MREGWEMRILGEVLLKTEAIDPTKNPDTEFTYLDVSSVNKETKKIENVSVLLGKDAPSRARKLVKTNDVIFATVRPTHSRVALITEEYDGQVCSTGYFVLRGKDFISNQYLFYFLLTDEFNEQMEKLQKGASYPAVTDTEVKNIFLRYPKSLPEQHRIVAILDEAFAAIAKAKANAEQNLKNAKELFESYLQEVFENENWEEKCLGDLCTEITVGFVGKMANKYKDTGVPFLRSQNIRPHYISLKDVIFIDHEFNATLKKSQLKPGDLAIVRTGYPGTAAVIPESLEIANCSDIVIVKVGSKIDSYFLCYFFNSTYGKKLVLGNLVGAAQKHFNVGAAKKVKIPVPPLTEQQSIVQKLDALSAETKKLEAIYQQKINDLEELKKSILQKAFSGELKTLNPVAL